ncbi:MAG: type II toxin-antitoxin system RelB/DinJ family antitoxin [Erysipelotrichaceae bacterium]|nr:type II toxin-antitoxin system RelB/DinJ family antitoxin [Erysipelotrichaceae bacterium]
MATITVRIDDKTKKEAEAVLKELGISASSAIHIFYRQIIRDQAFPFTPSLAEKEAPNKKTPEHKGIREIKALFDEFGN